MHSTRSTTSDLAVVDRFYAAMHEGDPVALLATLSDDFVAHVSDGLPGGFGGRHTGGERILRDCWAPVHARYGALPHPVERAVAGDGDGRFVVTGDYRGTAPGSGEPFSAAFVHLFRLAGGRIVDLRQVTDTRQWPDDGPGRRVAEAVFEAVRSRNLEALLAAYSDDIVISDDPGLPYGGVHRGREGAVAHAMGFAATWDPYQGSDERELSEVLVESVSQVVAFWRLRASRPEARVNQPTVTVLRMVDAKVTALEMYHADTAELRAFLGHGSR